MILKTDEELYTDFLNGNKQAFEELVIKYRKNLTYFISRYTKDIDNAEDLAQDVFIYILTNKNYYNPKYSLKTYLFTIAKSRAINFIKKDKRQITNIDFDTMFIDDFDLTISVHNKEKLNKINKILKEFKPDYQSAIYLADFEELSNSEISKILNKTPLQTKTLIYNARKKLKKILDKEGIKYAD